MEVNVQCRVPSSFTPGRLGGPQSWPVHFEEEQSHLSLLGVKLKFLPHLSVAWSLYWLSYLVISILSINQLKCDGTRAETRFRLLVKRTSLFKSVGVSVQSTTGSQGVRISGSNAGYAMFRGSVKSTGYPLHSPVYPLLPLPCITVCHHVSIEVYSDVGK